MIVFPVSRMNFLSLSEPSNGPTGGNPQYGIAVPVDEIPQEVAQNVPYAIEQSAKGRWGLFSLRTNRRPRIFGHAPDSSDLRPLWDYCALTQTSIDTLLRDQPAEMMVSLFEKTSSHSQDSYGVGLTAIRVNGGMIPLPSWQDLIEGKFPI